MEREREKCKSASINLLHHVINCKYHEKNMDTEERAHYSTRKLNSFGVVHLNTFPNLVKNKE